MLSRDALRYLRALNDLAPRRYAFAECSSRSRTSSTSVTINPRQSDSRQPLQKYQTRHFTQSSHATANVADQSSLLGDSPPPPPLDGPLAPGMNVRNYLKHWTVQHKERERANAPEKVQKGNRNASLPNNLFARDGIEPGPGSNSDSFDRDDFITDENDIVLSQIALPGDLVRIAALGTSRPMFAVALGRIGPQSQYLLSKGSWYVDTRAFWQGHIIRNWATPQEMDPVRAVMPIQPVEYEDETTGEKKHRTALGQVPSHISAPLMAKFAQLGNEVESFKRDHGAILDTLHQGEADETLWSRTFLKDSLLKTYNLDINTIDHGAALMLVEQLYHDERFIMGVLKGNLLITFVPKQLLNNLVQVTEWARAYQDAAARAAIGKDVGDDLRKNPLVEFVTKARRLVTKSRTIRTPGADGILSPTHEHLRPRDGSIIREPGGETFTDNERKIIQVLWHAFVRRPDINAVAAMRVFSVTSLILRAVGAYPGYQLDQYVGRLFLEELGCLDPWWDPMYHAVDLPVDYSGLNKKAKTLAKMEEAALVELKKANGDGLAKFPDSMASIRKDWGNLTAFAIDSLETRVVDDAISIEKCLDHPDSHWIHVHIAHPSAFIPFGHPTLQRAAFFGESHYDQNGSVPMIPFEVVGHFTISDKRPSPVLTCSTLLSLDGAIQDIRLTPSIIQNVVKLDKYTFAERFDKPPWQTSYLDVGQGSSKHVDSHNGASHESRSAQPALMRQHEDTLVLLHKVLSARADARLREQPQPLKMLVLPQSRNTIHMSPKDVGLWDHERIYRSEHCYGEPSIVIKSVSGDPTVAYEHVGHSYDLVQSSMTLASESVGRWASTRGVPVIYRSHLFQPGYDIKSLNKLGPNDPYLAPYNGDTVDPQPPDLYNIAAHAHCTSPMRKFRDLINFYQIDAYLKAETGTSQASPSANVRYPYSRNDLISYINHESSRETVTNASYSERQAQFMALYRAFCFKEHPLPQTWDVFVLNPLLLGRQHKKDIVRGQLRPFGFVCEILPSEEGWERSAKFRQYVPVKLQSVNFRRLKIEVIAVGPPSDSPHAERLYHSEFVSPETTVDHY